MIVVFASV